MALTSLNETVAQIARLPTVEEALLTDTERDVKDLGDQQQQLHQRLVAREHVLQVSMTDSIAMNSFVLYDSN